MSFHEPAKVRVKKSERTNRSNLWPLTRKHTPMVFHWTATRWRRWWKRWRHWKIHWVFSLPVQGVEKSRWEISPKPLETLEKAVGFFSLTVESAETSRWENSSYPLLQRRKLTYLQFRLGVCNQSRVTSRTKKYEVQFSDGTEEGERNLTVFETYNQATPTRKKKKLQ